MFTSLGTFDNSRLSPVENEPKKVKIIHNTHKYTSKNTLSASSNVVLSHSIIADHEKLLEAALLVYSGELLPQNINKHYNISRQRVTNIVNAMPQSLESDTISETKRLERAARNIIGIPISVYTQEELKCAIFAYAGGEYSYSQILEEYGISNSTLRKKMHELR